MRIKWDRDNYKTETINVAFFNQTFKNTSNNLNTPIDKV